jgi:hypothetical protein
MRKSEIERGRGMSGVKIMKNRGSPAERLSERGVKKNEGAKCACVGICPCVAATSKNDETK